MGTVSGWVCLYSLEDISTPVKLFAVSLGEYRINSLSFSTTGRALFTATSTACMLDLAEVDKNCFVALLGATNVRVGATSSLAALPIEVFKVVFLCLT